MIEGFEEYTHELTQAERVLLPRMVDGLKKRKGAENAITNTQMEAILKKEGYTVSGPRIRKLINYIRSTGEIPRLITSSKGYYIATDHADLQRYIRSLAQRESAIREIKEKAQNDFKQWVTPMQSKLFS